jgi:streptomycin 6-kinase
MNEEQEIDDTEAKRIYCQFCGMLFVPVAGRLPSLTCLNCWLEIRAGIEAEKKAG